MEQIETTNYFGEQKKSLFSIPYMICSSGKICNSICSSEYCKNHAFLCDSNQCQCRKNLHNSCIYQKSIQQFFNIMEGWKKTPSIQVKSIFNDIVQLYDEMIEKISLDREDLLQYMDMFGLSENMINAAKNINLGKPQQVNGDLVYQICGENQRDSKKASIYMPSTLGCIQILRDIQANMEQLFNKIAIIYQRPSKKIMQQLVRQKSHQLSIIGGKDLEKFWNFIPGEIQKHSKIIAHLNLSNNTIRKIDNVNQMKNLKKLILQKNYIRKIQNLQKLTTLTLLNLSLNRISKIENLGDLVNLRSLYLQNNEIQVIENLQTLQKLVQLHLDFNKISIIQNLQNLHSLERLRLTNNQICSIENLEKMINVKCVFLSKPIIIKDKNPVCNVKSQLKRIKELKIPVSTD